MRYWNSSTRIIGYLYGGVGSEKHEKFEKLENAFGEPGALELAIALFVA